MDSNIYPLGSAAIVLTNVIVSTICQEMAKVTLLKEQGYLVKPVNWDLAVIL